MSQHVTKVPFVSVATDDDDVSITKVRLSQPMTDAEAAECELQLVDIEMTSDDAIYAIHLRLHPEAEVRRRVVVCRCGRAIVRQGKGEGRGREEARARRVRRGLQRLQRGG